jgi:TonB family protein
LTRGTQHRGLSDRPYLVSLLCHAGLIGAIIVVATLNSRDIVDVIEVEIVQIVPQLEPSTAPIPSPTPPPPVPETAKVRLVEEARPYHPAAAELNQLPRQTSEDVAAPLTVFAIPMEATIGGQGGFEVVAVAGADPGMRGKPNAAAFPAVEYADTWEITKEPEPLNDRDFRPVYPPSARARRLEAAVEVELLVDSTGTVAGTRVLVSDGDPFSVSALEYCERLRFKPALANHVPVASRIVWVVDYRFGNR